MAKLSYSQLKTAVASLVTKAKISNDSFVETRDNIVGLLDKIGKIVTLDTNYQINKLNMFDGEYLSFGKTVEEWAQDLILIEDYNADGDKALSPHKPTYRPVFYSYTLGRKVIPTTIYNNDIERAVHFEEQFVSIIAMQYKRLEDSMAVYRYQVLREMLARLIELCEDAMASTNDSYAISTAYSVGKYLKNSTARGIVVKPIANTNTNTWAQAVASGDIIELDLIVDVDKPVDATTGEAFIKQVKADVEVATDLNEGASLNGNSLGATEGLVLVLKQGVMPSLQVDTIAGAFQAQELAFPVDVVVIKDFATADSKYFAVLMDRRGMRLHNTYNATRENFNGDGDWLNVFRHTEDTAYLSRNTFVKVYGELS